MKRPSQLARISMSTRLAVTLLALHALSHHSATLSGAPAPASQPGNTPAHMAADNSALRSKLLNADTADALSCLAHQLTAGQQETFRAKNALIALLSDPDSLVVCRAAQVLAELPCPGPETIEAISGLLLSREVQKRKAAIIALGHVELGEGSARIQPLLLGDENESVRAQAVTTLGLYHDARIIPLLLAAMLDNSATVRSCAIRSLAQYKDDTSLFVPSLIAALSDGDMSRQRVSLHAEIDFPVRYYAVRALSDLGSRSTLAVGTLRSLYSTHESPPGSEASNESLDDSASTVDISTQMLAAAAVLKISGPDTEAVDVLRGFIRSPDPFVREEALQSVCNAGNAASELLNDVVPLMSDSFSGIRRAAVQAIGCIGSAEDVGQILPLLHDDEGYVRSAAAIVLARLGGESANFLQEIFRSYMDSHPILLDGREFAEALCISVGPQRTIGFLIAEVERENGERLRSLVDLIVEIPYVAGAGVSGIVLDTLRVASANASDDVARVLLREAADEVHEYILRRSCLENKRHWDCGQ